MNDYRTFLQSDKLQKALCKPRDHVSVSKTNLSSGQKRAHFPACVPDNDYHVDCSTDVKKGEKIYRGMNNVWGGFLLRIFNFLTINKSNISTHKDHVKLWEEGSWLFSKTDGLLSLKPGPRTQGTKEIRSQARGTPPGKEPTSAPRTIYSQVLLMETPEKGQVAFKCIFGNYAICSKAVSKS